ncbi:siderophore-interacting protein [Amylibacter sp. SFDW26]|uniref:siderophore-interacting protein n=1 Tax=Amylibacter sp. SFDW26 TaxID=2652722 RepID=UPI001261EFAA|nr:siderophore-interacting protein [Amylibacter sp. SFDW26]KAB7615845.1 siderophore-interacting protein [Amylibacter sp. SFDW26]
MMQQQIITQKHHSDTVSEAIIKTPQSSAVRDLFFNLAKDHDLGFVKTSTDQYICATPLGAIEISMETARITIRLRSPTQENLYTLQDSVTQHIAHKSEPLAASLQWTGSIKKGDTPPNFRLMTVVSSKRISSSYYRIRLHGDALASFAQDGLHVRLLLPNNPSDPKWPKIGSNGQTKWPTGKDTLHKPVYTIRWIDPQSGLLDIDIFIHDGGRTSIWAASVEPYKKVGIMGPGGGWHPNADWILLAGDATALPAIARILENTTKETQVTAIIKASSKEDETLTIAPDNGSITWISIIQPETELLKRVNSISIPKNKTRYVWFAGEKSMAQAVRQHFTSQGLSKQELYSAGYWKSKIPLL